MKLLTAAALLALTGCAGPGYWISDRHSSQSQFDSDRKTCEYEAYRAEPLSPPIRMAIARKCMEARSYTWKEGVMTDEQKRKVQP
jgi:hypothetical protein